MNKRDVEKSLFDTFSRIYRELATLPDDDIKPEQVVTFLKENPTVIDDVAEVVTRYNRKLADLGMDSGRAGDIAKAFSGMIWSVVLESAR